LLSNGKQSHGEDKERLDKYGRKERAGVHY